MANDFDGKSVPIDKFLVSEREALQRFFNRWKAGRILKPDEFPETMPLADWWEQFLTFIELGEMQNEQI